MKKPPLGSGQRFAQLEKEIADNPKIKNPAAVAASIGRKKYGKKKFQKLAKKGKQRLMLHQKIARGMSPRS